MTTAKSVGQKKQTKLSKLCKTTQISQKDCDYLFLAQYSCIS